MNAADANSASTAPPARPMDATVSDAPLPEQTFFADPVVDRLMGVTIALAAEVYILRGRLRAIERTLGGAIEGGRELSAEEEASERRDATAFVAQILAPALGEQQARGPL